MHFPSPDLDEQFLPYVWPQGYAVRGELWRAYGASGGADALGPPITGAWTDPETGAPTQAFAHGVLSLPPGDSPMLLPLLDLLSRAGRDEWLMSEHGIPECALAPPTDVSRDAPGLDALSAEHLGLLSRSSYLWSHFLGARDWYQRYGFPTGYAEEPPHGPTLRTQKTVLRLTPDKVVHALEAGRLVRAWTDGSLIPLEALPAELSDRWPEAFPEPLPELPQISDPAAPWANGGVSIGPIILSQDPAYRRWMEIILRDLRETKPEFFRYVSQYVRYVSDGAVTHLPDGTPIPYADSPHVRLWTISFALPELRTIVIPHLNRTPAERLSALAHWFVQGLLVHEATHLRLGVERRKCDGRFAEAVCETERLRFFRAAHHLVTDTGTQQAQDFLLPNLTAPESAAAMADRLAQTLPTMGLNDYYTYLLSLSDD